MPYHELLAERVRSYLVKSPEYSVTEKKMFGGIAFMVNGKMCVNVSGQNLMCRFDPALEKDIANRKGYLPMIMKGRILKGYCYVEAAGYSGNTDFEFWMKLCLDFNEEAKAS
jgi:TfoX/Sxy family transcriptional regulator of competence genes